MGETIVTILTNFILYLMLHPAYKQELVDFGKSVVEAFFEDLSSEALPYPPYYDYDAPQQIEAQGYICEEHIITTDDGYHLKAFRIPGKLGEEVIQGEKQPIQMVHGLLDTGATWIFNDHTKTLSFQLVDRGYDVWLLSNRGSIFSNTHEKLTTEDEEFWDFSFHEMAAFDVPSSVEYIIKQTGFDQVIYVGHSEGTAQWFIAQSMNKSLSQYYKAFVGIGPAISMEDPNSLLFKAMDLLKISDFIYANFNSVLYMPDALRIMAPSIHALPRTIWTAVQGLVGFNDEGFQIDLEYLPMMGINDVGGTSAKNFMHCAQLYRSGTFDMFDYGEEENMIAYGQTTPPSYDFTGLKESLDHVAILLVGGENDALVGEVDFNNAVELMPSSTQHFRVPHYNHLDLVWAANANEVLNEKVINFIDAL